MTPYLSPEQIADQMFGDLKPQEKAHILEVPTAEDMIRYHHSVGRAIRNEFGLWREDNPYTTEMLKKTTTSEAEAADSPYHPDQVSYGILQMIWQKCRDEANAS